MNYEERILSLATFPELLEFRALHQPDETAFIFLATEHAEEITISYQALYLKAQMIAAQLQQSIKAGERVLLIYPAGLEFIAAFFACLAAGIIAVPVSMPRSAKSFNQLRPIIMNALPKAVLTLSSLEENIRANIPDLAFFITDKCDDSSRLLPTAIGKEDLAFLQYTSGSTGQPKGVMVSHANLLHNQQMIKKAFKHNDQTIIVGWLPFYHDMGLIGNLLQPIFLGRPCIFMPPMVFLQNPFFWLQTISRYRATTSGGPNFAYDLCTQKISEEQKSTLDLSSWSVAYNGAEPVQAEVIQQFYTNFSRCGFQKQAFLPCYGMAEATLIITGGGLGERPAIIPVDKQSLLANEIKIDSTEKKCSYLVGCGEKQLTENLAIVSPEDFVLREENEIGEIWVQGPSVTQGYWQNHAASKETFQAYIRNSTKGPYLRTGDLGFLNNDQLYIVGRLKDLIIIRGKNYYPQDIEQCFAKAHPAFTANSSAAFSIFIDNMEKLIVVQEIERSWRKIFNSDEASSMVRKIIFDNFELNLHELVFVKPGQVPKTSSGKVKRRACKALYENNALERVNGEVLNSLQLPEKKSEISFEALALLSLEEKINYCLDFFIQHISSLLKISMASIDINHSLSFLGVDSLQAVEIKDTLESKLKLNWSVVRFLQDETISQLAKAAALDLEAMQSIDPSFTLVEDEHLSSSQLPIWFWQQLHPDSKIYHVDFALKINQPLNKSAWLRTWEVLFKRHPIFRTTYHDSKKGPYKVIQDNVSINLEIINLSAEIDWQEILKQEVLLPFFLSQSAPFRLKLYVLEPNSFVFLFVAHHIACDLHAILILMQEFSSLYTQYVLEKNLFLPPLLSENRKFINSPQVSADNNKRYWLNKLANCSEVLNLPTDHSRPPIQSFAADRVNFTFDEKLSIKLSYFVKEQGTTLYVVLMMAFQILLHRYTQQDQILVGTAVSGRDHFVIKNSVNCFINTLVILANIDPDLSLLQYLKQVKHSVLEALQHQNYPFHEMVGLLQKKRDLSRSPVFQAMFILHNIKEVESELQTLFQDQHMDLLLCQKSAIFTDINLVVSQGLRGIAGYVEYNTDIFEKITIQKFAEHFQQLLLAIVNDPHQQLKHLSFISDAERNHLIHELNDNSANYSPQSLIFSSLAKNTQIIPNEIALCSSDVSLSYQDVNNQVNRMAQYLLQHGIGRNMLIGIALDRSATMLIALLAVLKIGAAYVPLDPTYPRERLKYIMADAKMQWVLTQTHLQSMLPEGDYTVLDVLKNEAYISGLNPSNISDEFIPSATAYVIYTSGSTGRPKGVAISHAALNNFLQSMQSMNIVQKNDVFLAVTTICFDIAVLELYLPLIAGARLVIADNHVVANAEKLAAEIQNNTVNIMQATPATWQLLLATNFPIARGFKALVGGEAFLPSLAKKLFNHGYEIYNLYGPTENTVWSSIYPVKHLAEDKWGKMRSIPIGKPLSNVQYYVFDQFMQLQPKGVPGQLYIGGNNLALNYLNRVELTEEKFIEYYFDKELPSRLYATGDLVRYLPDDNLEFLGRIDKQIKLRGYRIELEEIESALLLHSSISECVVLDSRNDTQESNSLIAFIVSHTTLADEELRQFLSTTLPAYMIPSFFEFVNELPRTLNNKIDRLLLLQTRSTYIPHHHDFIPPTTNSEKIVAAVWSDLLAVTKISAEDNFFHLGGHSLLALQVSNKLKESYGIHLSLQIFFENQTLKMLAKKIDEISNESAVEKTKVNAILDKIKRLSGEEVNKLLTEKS